MNNSELKSEILTSPLYSSFVGKARVGELLSSSLKEREGAWAQWAVESVERMSGLTDRAYVALVLSGKFYDPRGNGPRLRPHIEIPAWALKRADKEFALRLALMGNGLEFPWWIYSEVTAVKRALFSSQKGSIVEIAKLLDASSEALRESLTSESTVVKDGWEQIESLILEGDAELNELVTRKFSVSEVSSYFPAGRSMNISVDFDTKLLEKSPGREARRVGVWQVSGLSPKGGSFSFGVVTPRLTSSSLFRDPMFAIRSESLGALLVRGLILSRVISRYYPNGVVSVVKEPVGSGVFLRAIVAQPGKNMPQASVHAVINFLQTHPEGEGAWVALSEYSRRAKVTLTVTKERFLESHEKAVKNTRRAEDPERDDMDVILPIGWDDKNRVVRITFSKTSDTGDTK